MNNIQRKKIRDLDKEKPRFEWFSDYNCLQYKNSGLVTTTALNNQFYTFIFTHLKR